jgi:asparagine synthase (glutamine-hydrolysing)
MCGICGLVSLDGRPIDPGPLRSMMEALRHRGPDGDGQLVDGPVALGMRRLSVIDLAGGDQPIANEAGTVQVFQNGEIYNYRELRRDLEARGHRFATASDTEVLVHAYEELGDAFLGELRGMFAIALWDARRRRLLLARDRFGIKPLYYQRQGPLLRFASELHALPRGDVDPAALAAYLAFNSVPAPRAIYRDTAKLPAGHLLVWEADGGEPAVCRFARAGARPGPAALDGDLRGLETRVRTALADSVRAHLVADVPVGVLLSGGIDSAAITALAAEASAGPVRTFSIGFEERSFDELENARAVAQRYGTAHEELVLRPEPEALVRTLSGVFDEPFGDSSALPTYLVCGLAARSVKVVLSGEGGDELFGGYQTYVADRLARRAGRWLRPLEPAVARLPSSSRRVSLDYRAKRFLAAAHLPPLERHHGWKEIFGTAARRALLTPEWTADVDPLDGWRRRYTETEGAPYLARLQDVDLGTYLVDDLLVKTDRASMAHSVEARVPFLDAAVAELAFALPDAARTRRLTTKWLLRRAVAPLLPRSVARGPKRGFSIPAAAWLRGELAPFARDVLSPETLRRQGFFQPAAVDRLLADHAARRVDYSRQLWGLLAFTLWFDARRS